MVKKDHQNTVRIRYSLMSITTNPKKFGEAFFNAQNQYIWFFFWQFSQEGQTVQQKFKYQNNPGCNDIEDIKRA